MLTIKGNVNLETREIKRLRTQVISVFAELSKKSPAVLELQFNTNPKNYGDLLASINTKIDGIIKPLKSEKSLVALLHGSTVTGNTKTIFRSAFIDALYYFVAKKRRQEYLALAEVTADDPIKKITGEWFCYYAANNYFKQKIISQEDLDLKFLRLMITEETKLSGHVEYIDSDHSGSGTVTIDNNNLVFNLKNNRRGEAVFFIANCGSRPIAERESHVAVCEGIVTYINDSGHPKAAKCYLEYNNLDKNLALPGLNRGSIDVNKLDVVRRGKITDFFNHYNITLTVDG
jgi:hypothetical protein